MTLLQKVTAELTGAAGVDDITEIVVRNATTVFGANTARIYLLKDGVMRSRAAKDVGHAEHAETYDVSRSPPTSRAPWHCAPASR